MIRVRCAVAAITCAVLAVGNSTAHGQETLQQVRALYASAAYEEVLSMVSRLQAVKQRPEFEQYRVFCLVALGRTAEAEKAIASVIAEHPSFAPDAGEASPRIQEMFLRIRGELVPEIAQRMYLDARAAWDRKDGSASSQFASLVELIDSATQVGADGESHPKVEPMLSELRFLASGFLDLGRALSRPAPPIEAEAPAQVPPTISQPEVTPAVLLKQDLPVWIPPDQASRREFRGVIRVFISETGVVAGASLTSPIHPAYDRRLLLAAKAWTYQPALRNGAPVPSEKVIEVVLKPR